MTRFAQYLRGLRRHPVILGVIALFAVAMVWYFYPQDQQDSVLPLTAPVTRGSIQDFIVAVGEIKPIRVVKVGAQVSGQLKALHVRVGDNVSQGTLIAEIDAALQEKQIEASLAQLRGLETQVPASRAFLEFAQASLQRQVRLLKENATAEAQHDQAVSALAAAKAQLAQLESSIKQSKVQIEAQRTLLRYSRIEAPISGTISEVDVEVGQTLNAARETPVILNISDTSSMRVRSLVSEADVRRLQEGMPVFFSVLGNRNRRWIASLDQILLSPVNRGNVIYYPALFEVDNQDGFLLPEMTAEVFFLLQAAENVLMAPLAALTIPSEPSPPSASALYIQMAQPEIAYELLDEPGEGTQAVAYVVSNDGEISPRTLRIGARDLISAEILSGLAEGERVIIGMQVEDFDAVPFISGQRF